MTFVPSDRLREIIAARERPKRPSLPISTNIRAFTDPGVQEFLVNGPEAEPDDVHEDGPGGNP